MVHPLTSRLKALKASIEVTINEIVAANNHFAATQGLDLRDQTYDECKEILNRIERKLLSTKTKPKKRK